MISTAMRCPWIPYANCALSWPTISMMVPPHTSPANFASGIRCACRISFSPTDGGVPPHVHGYLYTSSTVPGALLYWNLTCPCSALSSLQSHPRRQHPHLLPVEDVENQKRKTHRNPSPSIPLTSMSSRSIALILGCATIEYPP